MSSTRSSPLPSARMNRKGSNPETPQAKCNVKVCLRCRPLSDNEKAAGNNSIVRYDGKSIICKGKTYGQFDEVFDPTFTQKTIFDRVVRPQVDRVLAGFNCTVFAYGQTGTGKTFTMEGGRSDAISSDKDPATGMTPRAVETIFQELEKNKTEEFTVRVSFVELYNEELYDLLAPNCDERERLRLFDDPSKKGAVVISGAEEIPVRTRQEVYELLKRGADRRTTAATLMNRNSSRSHSIFTVTVVVRESNDSGEELVKTGKLNLVDLAGSEHIGRSGAEGKRAKEAGNINQSLLTLGRVINALTTSAPHVPYRESKLTRMLQDSLGGSTITSIIATISPSSCSAEETISTLDYAMRAKNIKNHPECNQTVSRKALLKEYNAEIEKLRRDLFTARQKTGGVYLSTESYEDMERQLSAKEQRIDELSEKLEAQFAKLAQFMDDMALLDEQYRSLYTLNARFRSKLEVRVTELDETKKTLAETESKLKAVNGAFNEVHRGARALFSELQETREAVKIQIGEAEKWWNVEDDLVAAHSKNEKATFNSIRAVKEHSANIDDRLGEMLAATEKSTEKLETKIKEVGLSGNADIQVIRGNMQTIRHLVEGLQKNCADHVKTALEQSAASRQTHLDSLLKTTENLKTSSENTSAHVLKLTVCIKECLQSLTRSKDILNAGVDKWLAHENAAIEEEKKRRDQFREKFSNEANAFNTNALDMVNQLLQLINKKSDEDERRAETFGHLNKELREAHSARTKELPTIVGVFDKQATQDLMKSEEFVHDMEPKIICSRDRIKKELTMRDNEAVEFAALEKERAEAISTGLDKMLANHTEEVSTNSTVAGDACDRVDLALEDLSHDIKHIGEEQIAVVDASKGKAASSLGQIHESMNTLKRNWQQRSSRVTPPERRHPELDMTLLTEPPLKKEKILEKHGIAKEAQLHSRTRESLLEVANVPMSPGSLENIKKTKMMDRIDEESENSAPRV